LLDDFLALVFAVKLLEVGDALLDGGHGGGAIALLQEPFAPGARAHHQELRRELHQRPGQFVGLGVLVHKAEYFEIPGAITLHGVEVLELEKADVPVVVLDGLLLEPAALFRTEREFLGGIGFPGGGAFGAFGIKMEPGFVPQRLLTVGTAFGVHLQDAEVDA
jgi:hypothetical protein